ncbi:hypothetical protein PENSPDRAFT_274223 [Peniophora sp. CONT]|nr:hypothetical protein PENSPDRAFT_274223 [Peniophora sp. CONT]
MYAASFFRIVRLATRSPITPALRVRTLVSSRVHASHPHRHSLDVEEEKPDDTPKKTPRNKDIPFKVVRIVDPETKKPSDPMPLSRVLDMLKETVDGREVEVRYAEVVRPPSDDLGGYALVRLFDRAAMYELGKQRKVKALESRRKNDQKEIQLTWTAASGDVQHKLRKVRQEIERGRRVSFVVTEKDGHTPVQPAKRRAIMDEWLASLEDVAREWAPRSEAKHMIIVFLQHKDRALPSGAASPKRAK